MSLGLFLELTDVAFALVCRVYSQLFLSTVCSLPVGGICADTDDFGACLLQESAEHGYKLPKSLSWPSANYNERGCCWKTCIVSCRKDCITAACAVQSDPCLCNEIQPRLPQ